MGDNIITLDEQLDEIEYYEIITIDDMIKDNPDFKAFSREEIYDELYNFFQDSNKAENLTDLFYKNKKDHKNYVFITEATKKQYDEDIESFIHDNLKLTKLQYNRSQNAKNKLFFAIDYDDQSQKLRLKPVSKTIIEVQDNNRNLFYTVDSNDDINVPVLAVYYKKPKNTIQDYLSQKILSKFEHTKSINLVKTDSYNSIDKVIRDVKPEIGDILSNLPEDNINYQTVNNILSHYDTSYDDISVDDYNKLRNHYQHILETKPDIIKTLKYVPKPITYNDAKQNHVKYLKNIIQLVPQQQITEYDILVSQLSDEKVNINFPGLIFNNFQDMIKSIQNNDMKIEDIVTNIKDYKEIQSIDNAIKTINDIKQTDYNDVDALIKSIDENNKPNFKDLYDIKFVDFHKEAKDVKLANDFSNYDGIPPVYKNDQNFEGMIDRENDVENNYIPDLLNNEKILVSFRYKNNKGFREIMETVLKIFEKIQGNSALFLNYESLTEELYKYYAGLPTKFNILQSILTDKDISYTNDYIENLTKLTPNMIQNTDNDNITEHVKEYNKQYTKNLFEMIFTGLCWWTIQILEDHMNDFLIFDPDRMMVEYVDKWSLSGAPVDKDSKTGVIVYLSEITNDVFEREVIYTVPNDILKSCLKIFNDQYANELEYIKVNIKENKKNKGRDAYKTLKNALSSNNRHEKVLNDYIQALIYMPGYKFKKIHKFLLGCCLQKIGDSFVPDSDIIGINRTDLRDAKNKFSKQRATVKKSKKMFYIPKSLTNNKNNSSFNNHGIITDHDSTDIFEWVNNVNSSLLPLEIVENINSKGSKYLQSKSMSYIDILIRTSGNKKKPEFESQIFKNHHLNLLKYLNTIFIWYPGNEEETMLLKEASKSLTDIIRKLPDLNKQVNDENKRYINDINNYILARAMCLPFNPDASQNEILTASIKVSYGFVKDFTNNVYNSLLKYITSTTMPTIEENTFLINSIRERNKNEQLKVMNKLTQEERQLEKEIKKMGISLEKSQNIEIDEDYNDDLREDYEDVDIGDNDEDD